MRHHNPKSTSCWSFRHGQKVYEPYNSLYTYAKPSSKRTYVKVIQHIADHDGCKRFDIQQALWGCRDKHHSRGQMSSVFANLLYDDMIDYDKGFHYHITKRGLELLKRAYLNDNLKLITNPNYGV